MLGSSSAGGAGTALNQGAKYAAGLILRPPNRDGMTFAAEDEGQAGAFSGPSRCGPTACGSDGASRVVEAWSASDASDASFTGLAIGMNVGGADLRQLAAKIGPQ